MPLTAKQNDYLMNYTHRWNFKGGATGSGKTYLDVCATIPKRLEATRGEGLIVLMGNTRGTLERNILDPMREVWPGLVGNIRADNTVDVWGKKCYALGADNKKHVQRIQGATFEYVYGDEVTTWAQDVFEMLKSRLRCPHSYFDGTYNPAGPNHWLKKFLESGADVYNQNYIIDDNCYLPQHFVDNLKQEYAGTVYYDRYILGRWALAEGLVYPMFSRAKHVYSIAPWEIDGADDVAGEYYISIDYGTMNPTSIGLWRIYHGVAYRTAEYYYSGRDSKRQLTDEEYYYQLEALAGNRDIEYVVVDPSAASFIATIRQHGRFSVLPAKNAVLDGIRKTASAINSGKIMIHESCQNIIREFESYCWDEKIGEDTVIKENDHAMDDMRYMVMTVLDQGGQVYDVLF